MKSLIPFDNPSLYRAAVGSLMYASTGTRPDIAFAVRALSQFASNPGPEHWTAVKRVFRYLRGTLDHAITYEAQDDDTVVVNGFSDADWAQDPMDRRSISGNVFHLAGGAISWASKKQPTVALSSMEAEYMAASVATQQTIWLRNLFTELNFQQHESSTLFLDNRSAIHLASDPQFHNRSKHIDIRHHFVRERQDDGTINIVWIPTEEMAADILTKSLPRPKFEKLRFMLGMTPV